MEKRFELAKKQGLNWQALLIEETQSQIKVLIQKLVLEQKTFYEINKAVVAVVSKTIKELENEQLKQRAESVLYAFATKVYNYVKQTYQGLNWLGIAALIAVANNKGTVEQIRYVNELAGNSTYNVGLPLDVFSKDYMQFVKERIDKLAKYEAKEDYTSRVNLRNIAEMEIREERHERELADLKEKGVELVWIVPHANCSERCQEWQGKLYSLNRTSGTIDGISYQPLENATDIYQTTKSGKIYKNGCISGFNCFDKDTEVLTNKGWKLFYELNGSELMFTLNTQTKTSEWQKPLCYYKGFHKGKMMQLKSYTSDLLVTPNHNMLYYTQRKKELRFKEAQNISKNDILYCGLNWHDNIDKDIQVGKTIVKANLFCRLLGYWLADGSVQDKTSIKIAQQNNDVMWESLQELPFRLWRDKNKIVIRNKDLHDLFMQLGTCQTKKVFEWVKELSRSSLQELLNAYIFTDGYKTKPSKLNGYEKRPHQSIFTTNKQLCADLCEIALKCGYRPKVETRHSQGKEQQFKNGVYTLNYDLYTIHLNYNTSFRYKSIEKVEYNDYVYCVEVPNHTLLVKRNGYIQWCGNCRHTLEEYKKGNKPVEIPSRVIDKQREINKKQRYLERGVREWKERALLTKNIDKQYYKYAREKAKEWNERYIKYCEDNGVAYYPSRTEII